MFLLFFFFNDTATTEIYTLSLHDALPISTQHRRGARAAATAGDRGAGVAPREALAQAREPGPQEGDRKSTRLNSSHPSISYAVFCLKKKNSHTRRGEATADAPSDVKCKRR